MLQSCPFPAPRWAAGEFPSASLYYEARGSGGGGVPRVPPPGPGKGLPGGAGAQGRARGERAAEPAPGRSCSRASFVPSAH